MTPETQLLSVIAGATVVMAFMHIGLVACVILVGKRINRLVEVVEREIRPALDRVDAISADAARAGVADRGAV